MIETSGTRCPVTSFRLRYVHEFRDRHGKVRRYFRRPGYKTVPLLGLPGSAEFMDAYRAAVAGETATKELVGRARSIPGSVAALISSYYGSAQFLSLSPSTQTTYRGIIERFRVDHGNRRVAMLERRHIVSILQAKIATPAAGNNWLRMIRMLMQFAIDEGLRRDDPTFGVKGIRRHSAGFHTWTEEEIETYAAHHAPGTRARRALALLLFTAQRRSDVIVMGRQHIRSGRLVMRQQKTGVLIDIPIHPELQAVLDATSANNLTFLTTAHGKPFTAAGFGNWFRECCVAAGLPKRCSAHGLRKAASRRLAEAGCTPSEIGAITGHTTLKEIERYTAAADRRHLADIATSKHASRTAIGKPK